MHVIVATVGSLDTKKAADLAAKLAGGAGRVTVFTVVEVPRGMLDEMRAATDTSADDKARELSVEYRTSQARDVPVTQWVGDDAVVARYVSDKVEARTAELAAELEAAGVEHTVVGVEGENAARSVLEAVETHGADVLCVGTHGLGRFEGFLGSLSSKVARHASCSVVLIR